MLLISLLKCLKVRWTLLCSLLDSAVAGALSSHPKSFAALANNCASSLVIPPTTTILTGAFNYYTYRYDTNSSMLMTINQSSKCVYHNICDISNMFSYSNKHIIYSVSIYDSIYMWCLTVFRLRCLPTGAGWAKCSGYKSVEFLLLCFARRLSVSIIGCKICIMFTWDLVCTLHAYTLACVCAHACSCMHKHIHKQLFC